VNCKKYEFSPFNSDHLNIYTSFTCGGSSSQSISINDLKLIELLHNFYMNWIEYANKIINGQPVMLTHKYINQNGEEKNLEYNYIGVQKHTMFMDAMTQSEYDKIADILHEEYVKKTKIHNNIINSIYEDLCKINPEKAKKITLNLQNEHKKFRYIECFIIPDDEVK
jgi:hypothetical protein